MKIWIERQRNILDFALSSILRRKRKNAALIFVYALVVFVLGSVLLFSHALKREASIILAGSPEMVVQRVAAGRHEQIPVSDLEKIRSIPGVVSARARLWGYYYDPISGANYTLVVPESPGPEPGSVSIGEGVARVRLSHPGDTIEFRAFDGEILEWEVVDLIPADSALVSSDLVLVNEADFRRLFGVPEKFVTDLVLEVANPLELPTIAVKVAEILPATRQILRDDLLRTYDAVFDWRGGLVLVVLAGALLAFIIFAWDKASGLSADEKREIGILKAVGWETSDVILMKAWEGMAVSLTAFLAGLLLGYAHVFLASAALLEPVLKGWAVLYPKFRPVPYIDGEIVAALFFLSVVPYTVATVIPSWRAAIVDPDSVMK